MLPMDRAKRTLRIRIDYTPPIIDVQPLDVGACVKITFHGVDQYMPDYLNGSAFLNGKRKTTWSRSSVLWEEEEKNTTMVNSAALPGNVYGMSGSEKPPGTEYSLSSWTSVAWRRAFIAADSHTCRVDGGGYPKGCLKQIESLIIIFAGIGVITRLVVARVVWDIR